VSSSNRDERFFADLAFTGDEPGAREPRAPSRLKSRIYSTLVRRQTQTEPLLSLTETKTAGRALCVFENLLQIMPFGESAKSFNACSVCHARVLAEHMEKAPIFWPHCPYVGFQKR